MVSESNLQPSQWKTGRVIEVFPGSDGLVRVVKVRTESGDYLRAIHRLVLLEPSSASVPLTSGENDPAKIDA